MKKTLLGLALLLSAVAFFAGCSQPQSTQTPAAPEDVSNENLQISASATRSEALLGESKTDRVLPEDHWLRDTPIQDDTVPAIVAPEAPRELIAEHGPAYLERIGDTRVLHLEGSYYDMGFQHGTLMKDEILMGARVIASIGKLAWEKDFKASCREAWQRTSPHIPDKFKEEIRGMAEATGLPIEEVQDFAIFPELFHCSGFALWGKATADGALLHGRVLDYMREAGMDKWALIIIQKPEGAHAFVNVGYSGLLGSVTGMSMNHIAIGEMGGGGKEQWDGMPMTFLIRECLETADTLDDVRRIMENTPRTCEYYYVISDSKAADGRGSAFGVAAWPDKIDFIGPNEAHKRLPRPVEDAVLLSAGGRYQCLVDRVEKMYGQITSEVALDIMARGVSMKSNMHNALFKPATLELWVANSTIDAPACNLAYHHYDLNELTAQRP